MSSIARGAASPAGLQPSPGRVHFFNGRLLTAQALQGEQAHWDARARALAHVTGCGIAWGLIVSLPSRTANAPGFALSDPLQLGPGLAFDARGRSVRVGRSVSTTFGALLTQAEPTDRQVVTASPTRFRRCLKTEPAAAVAAGVADGAYVLAIRARERAAGLARVHGEMCPDPTALDCVPDVYCDDYELGLVDLRLDVGLDPLAADPWTLRARYAAVWFDHLERPLHRRFPAGFPEDAAFWNGPAVPDLQEEWIGLALLFVRGDRVAFCDTQIPRRLLTETAAGAWGRGAWGASSFSPALARVLWFQQLVAERRAAHPQAYSALDCGLGDNHAPPCGYLPVDDYEVAISGSGTLPVDHTHLELALKAARRFFAGTNTLILETVVVHGDDLQDAVTEALTKDPIALRPASADLLASLKASDLRHMTRLFDVPKPAAGGAAVGQPTSTQPVVEFSDDTFPTADWDTVERRGGPDGTIEVAQRTSGGDPGAFRETRHKHNSSTITNQSILLTFHFRRAATYDPSTQGGIAQLELSATSKLIDAFSGSEGFRCGLALRQNGNLYVCSRSFITPERDWTPKSVTAQFPTEFGEVLSVSRYDFSRNPDFSPAGAPIELGFYQATSHTSSGTQIGDGGERAIGFDNWKVTVTPVGPSAGSPSTSAVDPGGWLGEPGRDVLRFLLARGLAGPAAGVTLEQLVQREVEVLRVLVPLAPTHRRFAITGLTDAEPGNPPPRPHDYLLYVKQRMTLPAWSYHAARVIQDRGQQIDAAFWARWDAAVAAAGGGVVSLSALAGAPTELLNHLLALQNALGDDEFLFFMGELRAMRPVTAP